VDADTQGSSSAWLHEASPQTPVFRLQTPDEVLEQVPELSRRFDALVIDGPAGLSEVTRAVLLVADRALLPCGPSALDLRAAADAIRVLKQAQNIRFGPPTAVLVPNKLQIRHRLSREFVETARTMPIPAVAGLRLRQAYADAAGQGSAVWRMGSHAQAAADEMQNLFREMVENDQTQNADAISSKR